MPAWSWFQVASHVAAMSAASFAMARQHLAPEIRLEWTPKPQNARCTSALGIGHRPLAIAVGDVGREPGVARRGQVGVELGVLIRVQVELTLARLRLSWLEGEEPCASCSGVIGLSGDRQVVLADQAL